MPNAARSSLRNTSATIAMAGQGGERGAGPKIYPNPFPYQAFVMQVRRPRLVMPPYTDKHVSDQDLADIYHYLFSTKPSPAAKDIPLLRDF